MKQIIGFNVVIGVWLVVWSLTIGHELTSSARVWNALFFGLIVVGASAMVLADMPGQTAWRLCALLAGAWLLVAPLVLPYRDHAFTNDAIFGALILVVSAIEIWWSHGTSRTS